MTEASNHSPTKKPLPTVLTIAGFDPSGGAGLQADSKTIHALGAYALNSITAVTVQNSFGVQAVHPTKPELLQSQLQCLAEDYQFDAIKIGMLADHQQVKIVADFLTAFKGVPSILDPVLISSSGKTLLAENARKTLITELLPAVTLVTPNIPEAELLLKAAGHELNDWQQKTLFKQFSQLGVQNLLLKGGHRKVADEPSEHAEDWLFTDLPQQLNNLSQHIGTFTGKRLQIQHNHGTGCTLSSAIATFLAEGKPLKEAVKQAKTYLTEALKTADLYQPNYRSKSAEIESQRHGGLNHFIKSF